MGFDLYGYKNDVYYQNNVWGWRPLWRYVCSLSEDILSEDDMYMGCYNNGHHINGKKTNQIIRMLELELKTGKTEEYSKSFETYCNTLPDEVCDWCEGTGKRVEGRCNKCEGTGKVRPFITEYSFDTDNVREFVEFLKTTEEGFTIF